MGYAVYLCQLGCDAECEHGEPCGVFRMDAEHPHPVNRGRPAHIGWDGTLNHEWDGARGKCRTSPPPEDE